MRCVVILLAAAVAAHAYPDDKAETVEDAVEHYLSSGDLPRVQVTATRLARDPFDTPRAVTVISREQFVRRRPVVALHALDEHPGLWVERRTGTTADPVMRGFAGFNLLALIDGNTLTTLWGEGGDGGDDMYGKIDSYLVDRIEVVRGQMSVLYGTNNLGGVINFLLRSSRYDYTDEGIAYGGRFYADFSSVNSGVRGRIEHHGAAPAWRWLVGFTAADYDDVRAGGDVGLQVPTSGEETSFDFKVQHLLADHHELEVFLQRMDRDHTNRFYRPMQTNFNDRVATGITYRGTELGSWIDRLEARFYFQHKKDVRYFFDQNRRGRAVTDTFVSAVQATSNAGPHRLTYGIAWERDDGESPDDEQFTLHTPHMDDFVKDAPDSLWDDVGFYLQDEWEIGPGWSLIAAVRFDYFNFKTQIDPSYDPPGPLDPEDDRYSDSISALTGGIGVVYRANEDVHLIGNLSRGFRQSAPNFGARQTGGGILVPNTLLDPVTTLAAEVGVKVRKQDWWLDVFFYRTEIFDAQNPGFGTFQGEDFFDFNQNGVFDPDERVLVIESDGRAWITGIEIEGHCGLSKFFDRLPDGLGLRGGFAWNMGHDRTRDEPWRKVHPMHAILAVTYDEPAGRWWVEFSATMVAEFDRVPSDRIANDPGFRSNPQDITSPLLRPDGSLPGYTVFDIRGGYRISEDARVEIALENITDKKYRRLHSRMDAPGFGIRVGFTLDF